jgi:exosortase/archaeosortase family protein
MHLENKNSLFRERLTTGPKRWLVVLLIGMSFVLLALPWWMSFQDILTRTFLRWQWYGWLQGVVVPYQVRIIGGILRGLGMPVGVGLDYLVMNFGSGEEVVLHLAWNCIGWQSFVLMIITLIIGLAGRYTWRSKLLALSIGLMGTYLVNIFRLVLVVMIYYQGGQLWGRLFHDYSANLIAIAWVFGYWWYVYKQVLEEK